MVGYKRRLATLAAFLGPLVAGLMTGETRAESLPTGQLIEDVFVAADPAYSYTLFLPSSYTDRQRWPLLFIMDPRGRGTRAAEIFQQGAEHYGYILVSSNNTRSDGDLLPNQRAINVTLPEVARRFSLRTGDLYLAGMSGTSRVAWMAGHLMAATVAGVIGSAGATSGSPLQPGEEAHFDYFATAANRDFNYREMLEVQEDLIAKGGIGRLAYVDGGHSWPPAEVASQALGWMRLQAFRRGQREMEPELIDSLLASVRSSASAHETDGRELDALLTYRGIVEDFGTIRPTDSDRAAIARLERSRIATRQLNDRRRWSRREDAYPGKIASVTTMLRQQPAGSLGAVALDMLDVESLLSTAEQMPATEDSLAAERMLATLYSQMSFYLFRDLYQANDWMRAEVVLEIANVIQPDTPGLLFNLACVRALSGRKKKALSALEESVTAGFDDLHRLLDDEDLKTLRQTPGFQRIIARLEGAVADAAEGQP